MIGATAINKVILMGRLTAAPELRQTSGGISYCDFNIAVTRAYQSNNGEKETDFIRCKAWRQTAEFICRNFSKGKLILAEGSLRTGSYDDSKHPDVKHYTTDVYVDNVGFGETKSNSQYTDAQAQGNTPPQTYSNPLGQAVSNTQYQQAQVQRAAETQQNNYNVMNDFEEIISDESSGDLPF